MIDKPWNPLTDPFVSAEELQASLEKAWATLVAARETGENLTLGEMRWFEELDDEQ